jgi:thiol:disulfide interchange protein
MSTPRPIRRSSTSGKSLLAGLAFVAIVVVVSLAIIRLIRGGNDHSVPSGFSSTMQVDAALSQASTSNKPTLLFFTASWCPPCKAMKRDVLSDASIASVIAAQYVAVYVDVDERSVDARRFQVSSMPTFVVLNPDGTERVRRVGGMPRDAFASFLASK